MNSRLMAVTVVAALISLVPAASHGQAQDRRGFTPPGSGFGGNPFQARPGAANDAVEEEDFDDFADDDVDDISDEILRQRMEQRLRERGSAKGAANAPGGRGAPPRSRVDFGKTGQDLGNTSLAGGANTKITPGKEDGCLKLDPYTGYGPDIVTNFDFPDADIVEIAKTLGRLTCLNFILDKDVKGRISVVSNSPITVGDAWKAFLTGLDVNGFTIVPSGKYLRISRQRDAKDKQIKTYAGDFTPDTDLYITRVLPLKYISADEVARVFRNFMPPNTRIISYDQTNTLIVTDTGSNIKKIVDMVQLLDVEGFDEGLEVIRIKFASAQDLAKLIDQLLPGSQGTGPGAAPAPGGIPRFRSGFAARKTKEGGVISHIIPDDRTNSVIVSANAKGLAQVRDLIRKLDAKVAPTAAGSRIRVVYLQFADAEQVAQTLNSLAATAGAPRSPVAAAPGQPPATTASLFEGAIKISADKATNSLVITGTAADFQTINQVIGKLDVPRDQVYVEAIIMEMSLDKQFEIGTNIAAPTSGIFSTQNGEDFGKFLLNPLSVPGLVLGIKGGKGGKTFQIPGTTTNVEVSSIQGLIKALQQNTNSNVLATPQILTLDNQEAFIEIAENIPIPTQTAVPNAGVSTSITREKVSLSLKIKPQINKASDFVKLDIEQKLADFSGRTPPKGVADLALATTERSSKSSVVVQDGDTVAMGGLVRDKVSEQHRKVPILGDIPLLGWLFSSKTTSATKQNLLVFITPKIIKQYQQVRQIVDKKLRQRDEFMERNAGGDDPLHEYKMDLVKSLPPVSELKSGGRVESSDLEGVEDERPADEDETIRSNYQSLKRTQPRADKNNGQQPGNVPVPPSLQPPTPLDSAASNSVIQGNPNNVPSTRGTAPGAQPPANTAPAPGAGSGVSEPSLTPPAPIGPSGNQGPRTRG